MSPPTPLRQLEPGVHEATAADGQRVDYSSRTKAASCVSGSSGSVALPSRLVDTREWLCGYVTKTEIATVES